MKKILSLVIAVCMLFSAVPAVAEEAVLKTELFDRIEEVAKKAGCTVFRNDVSIGVTKGEKSFVVMNDTVTYMENGVIVNESLYVDGIYVKMPQKAIDNVLTDDMPAWQMPDEKYVYNRYFKDAVNNDYVYMRAINKSVEDEDCIVEIKEVLIGAENTYITAKITAKSEQGKNRIKTNSDYTWINFYGTTHGNLITDIDYNARSVTEGDARYFLYKFKTGHQGTLKKLRVECCYNHVYEYLDVDIPDMEETLKVDFDGGYVILKPLRIEYHLTEPKGTEAEKAKTPNIMIKFKDGSEKFIQEMCVNVAAWTTQEGIVIDYVNYFKEELDLESVESVVVHGEAEYKQTSEEYRKALSRFNDGEHKITYKTETDYGTIVEWKHVGLLSLTDGNDYENYIAYIRGDGTVLDVASYTPNADDINKMMYKSLEISADGKTAIITYPEIKYAGTFVVTIDLVNCTVKRDIIPYEEKEEAAEEITWDDGITASGLCEGYFWIDEESRPEATVEWEYKNGTLTISGTGDMHDFYYTYGGRKTNTTTLGKPWKEYYDKIEKVVIKDGVNSVSRYAFVDCKNLKEVIIADNVTIGREAFKNLKNLEKITLGKNCTLERNAFITCTSLQAITLSEGSVVGEGAFNHCYSLKNVVLEGENISVDKTAFDNCPMLAVK